jgi:Ca2+-binding EF-hand superfamily protein
MDLDGDGKVSFVEFMTAMLHEENMADDSPKKAVFDFRDQVQKALKEQPGNLEKLLKSFMEIDKNKDGFLNRDEIKVHIAQLQHFLPEERKRELHSAGEDMNKDSAVDAIMAEIDTDESGEVDFYEFLAFFSGRRKQPVELLCYDISGGIAKRYSTFLLGRQFEAIYHTGTLVFGTEFWYGGKIFQNEPPCKQFCDGILDSDHEGFKLQKSEYYPSLKSYHVGYTLRTVGEMHEFMNSVVNKYTADKYDVLTHNCNAFTEEFVEFLCGHPIPDTISRMPELVMKTPTARLLRPMLNRWLGGFQGGKDCSCKIADYDEPDATEGEDVQASEYDTDLSALISETQEVKGVPVMVYYTTSSGSRVLAAVSNTLTENGEDLFDLRWFEKDDASKFQIVTRVPRHKVEVFVPGEHALNHTERALAAIQVVETDMNLRHEDDKEAKLLLSNASSKLQSGTVA